MLRGAEYERTRGLYFIFLIFCFAGWVCEFLSVSGNSHGRVHLFIQQGTFLFLCKMVTFQSFIICFFFQSDFSPSFWTNYCWLVFMNDWLGRHGICVSLLCLLRSGISPRSLFIYLFSNLDIDIGFCGLFVSLPLQGNDTRIFFSLWFLLFYSHLCNCAVHKFHFFPLWYVFSVNVVILLFCHMKISHSVPLFSLIEIA